MGSVSFAYFLWVDNNPISDYMPFSPKSDKKEESFYGGEQRKIFCTDHIVQ